MDTGTTNSYLLTEFLLTYYQHSDSCNIPFYFVIQRICVISTYTNYQLIKSYENNGNDFIL